ncbi:GYDIA family GHMP kinase, partial [Psychroserpens sp.]
MNSYYSHGKLLLTGEYVVLDGALSLAIPTKFGQDLTVTHNEASLLLWKSFDENDKLWFEAEFDLNQHNISCINSTDKAVSERLLQILKSAQSLNSQFLKKNHGYKITTQLEFPKNWGLGTSSTLINNISNWANINPYILLELTFGGSGYDIACARADGSLMFQLNNNEISRSARNDSEQLVEIVDFNPNFKEHIYFVYLNQKQNSREGIAQ